MPSISDPIISIKGLGKKTSDRLNQLGIHTLEHLVFHLPSRYQDKTSITSLSDASLNDEILIEATIDRIEVIPSRQRQLLCYLSDNQNYRILLRFFHFTQYQKQALIRGETMQCFGEIKIGRKGLEMHHPEYRIITQSIFKYESVSFFTFSGFFSFQQTKLVSSKLFNNQSLLRYMFKGFYC